jgi:hypothetical protein
MVIFHPREVGSTETGPQLFAGTTVPNTTFYFNPYPVIQDVPGLLNSAIISNAGRVLLNGTYTYAGEFNLKPLYVNPSNPDLFIVFFENQWQVYDYTISFSPIYFSNQNVLYPWNVTLWNSSNSVYNPVPVVTRQL